MDLKVDGIMTDRPSDLKEFLVKNGKYMENEWIKILKYRLSLFK